MTLRSCIDMARAWTRQLDAHIEMHGLRGYHPFDIKQHPWIRAAQSSVWPRRATTVLCDVFPVTLRRLLRTQPTENAKAFALTALAYFRLHEVSGEGRYLDAGTVASQLAARPPLFRLQGAMLGLPVRCACEGSRHARRHAHWGRLRHCGRGVRGGVSHRGPHGGRRSGSRHRRVHAWASAQNRGPGRGVLFRIHANRPPPRPQRQSARRGPSLPCGRNGPRTRFRQAAAPALAFTIRRQRFEGYRPYGEWSAEEPFEEALLGIINPNNTGFVLRSLFEIHKRTPRYNAVAQCKFHYRAAAATFTTYIDN